MKTVLYTFLLISFCSLISLGQKKYIIKINTLDNHKRKGLLFKVDDKGIYILPQAIHWDLNVKENNFKNAQFIDFRTIDYIQIRRKGSVGKGILIGYVVGTALGFVIAKSNNGYDPNDQLGISRGLRAFSTIMGITGGGLLVGTIGGSLYPHQFEVKKDTFALHKLKVQLKDYEWYHKD